MNLLGRLLAKQVTCDCGFMVRTNTEDEVVKHVQMHGKDVHSLDTTREQALAMAKTVEAAVV